MGIRSVVKQFIPQAVFRKIEPLGHLAEAVTAQTLYGFPARKLKIIGVTGTDGKTTTASLIAHLLKSSGQKVAVVTTVSIDYADGQSAQANPTSMTTPNIWKLVKQLRRIRAQRPDWLVLEVSSHALAQNRVWGIPFSIAVMTNVSREHLDYHGSFANYLRAKQKLFRLCNANHRGLRLGVINADDANSQAFFQAILNHTSYGIKTGDLKASDIELKKDGSHFSAKIDTDTYHLQSALPGQFNIYNCLAAVAVGRALGLRAQQIEAGIASFVGIAGRMQPIATGQDFTVLIDYAVTPEALKQVLISARNMTKGKVRLVFGATGDRDRGKRPLMGAVAAEYADFIYLTDDETYTEDPAAIRQAVYNGLEKAGGAGKTKVIDDRLEAINQAIASAEKDDVILVTGIGHQTSRNMGGKKQPWDEKAVVMDAVKNRSNL
ncbi:UDP-N-acetylmuramoyl-L-alanyl-D-glutamate--2,6-diaminopimelate ligase [Candidatus Saccharibacteria bacterium]|nr:UDP-N-acetylmuramoyl-L-alanyl-D-glutamate--2,6-diaminopimelate ligase [Candidatus Saccharibacteria bacterium]